MSAKQSIAYKNVVTAMSRLQSKPRLPAFSEARNLRSAFFCWLSCPVRITNSKHKGLVPRLLESRLQLGVTVPSRSVGRAPLPPARYSIVRLKKAVGPLSLPSSPLFFRRKKRRLRNSPLSSLSDFSHWERKRRQSPWKRGGGDSGAVNIFSSFCSSSL